MDDEGDGGAIPTMRAVVGTIGLVVGTIGLVAGTAVAIWRGRPVTVLALLALCAVVAVVELRRLLAHSRMLASVAVLVLTVPVAMILAVRPARDFVAFTLVGLPHRDGPPILTADLVDGARSYRVSTTVRNDADDAEVVSRIGIATASSLGLMCEGAQPERFAIRVPVHVLSGDRNRAEIEVQVADGAGYRRWASGRVFRSCGDEWMTFAFRTSVVIDPHADVSIAVDLPHQLRFVGAHATSSGWTLLPLGDGRSPNGYALLGLRIDRDGHSRTSCVAIAGDPARSLAWDPAACSRAEHRWGLGDG